MITTDIIHRLPIGAKLLSFTLLLMSNSWAAAENVDTRQLLQLSEYISRLFRRCFERKSYR